MRRFPLLEAVRDRVDFFHSNGKSDTRLTLRLLYTLPELPGWRTDERSSTKLESIDQGPLLFYTSSAES